MHGQKVVLITGASAEMGVALVQLLVDSSCLVYAQVHSNKDALSFVNAANLVVKACDLSTERGAQELVTLVAGEAGRIDILINLIGPYDETPLLALKPSEWRQQLHFNLDLAFLMTHFAKEHLMASKGQVLNFAFAGADLIKARVSSTAYCIAKAGILILTKSFAAALAPLGVRVNCLSPGLMRTKKSDKERLELIKNIPWAREGEDRELALAARWLLFDSPEYINGANLSIAGAWEYIS